VLDNTSITPINHMFVNYVQMKMKRNIIYYHVKTAQKGYRDVLNIFKNWESYYLTIACNGIIPQDVGNVLYDWEMVGARSIAPDATKAFKQVVSK
jgi:hypothetical protein